MVPYVIRTKKAGARNWLLMKKSFLKIDRAMGYAEAIFDSQVYEHVKVCIPSGGGFVDYWKDGVEYKEGNLQMPGRFIIEEKE